MPIAPFRPVLLAPVFFALALLAAGGPALAASHDRDTFIREQDLDGDGRVTKEEFARGRDAEFARMDADHDGRISRDEYVADFRRRLPVLLADTTPDQRTGVEAREMRQVEVRFGVLDSDRSGGITPAEFAYSGWRMFTRHDTNGDGVVSHDDPIPFDKG